MNSKNKIFLLGGHDLEMLEIKKILDKTECAYSDRNLSWGAKLSDYGDILDDTHHFIGIELEEDIALPENYTAVDHHGDKSNRPSSLEQVAEMLEIKLTLEQTLIAANDSRYIAGMQTLCATNEEILSIRQRDREAQGITQQDEELAKRSILGHSEKSLEHIMVHALTSRFSAITDRLYHDFSYAVIYNETALSFYGYKISDVKQFFKDKGIDEKNFYYGGGENGFIGIKNQKNLLDKDRIKEIAKEWFEMQTNTEPIYSYHTFMFPFRFDFIKGKKGIGSDRQAYFKAHPIDERVSLKPFFKLNKSKGKEHWQYKPFSMDSDKDYNEYVYFHDFVRDALYNKSKDVNDAATSYYFEQPYEGFSYIIKAKEKEYVLDIDGIIKAKEKEKEYVLDIDGISLRLFDTGVAILSIELTNRKYKDHNKIFIINDFGRRVYPQFLSEQASADFAKSTKKAFLPQCITIKKADGSILSSENFVYDSIPKSIKIADFILKLLGEDIFTTQTDASEKYYIRPILDDRMYVLSWLGDDRLIGKCINQCWETEDDWYRYVFVDGGVNKTVQSPRMHKSLVQKATYDRWEGYKTLYGITRYSFVCLSANSDFTKSILPLPHIKSMYFQMSILLLAMRASLLRFSDEVTAISNIENGDRDDNKLSEQVSSLYRHYIRFVNKLYFREISAQDQGIELYNLACEQMQIHSQVKALDEEIAELHNYVKMQEEKKRNERLENISKLGAIFLPPSLLAGMYGMNIIEFDTNNSWFGVAAIFISAILGFLTITNIRKKYKIISAGILMLVIIGSVVCFPTINKSSNDDDTTHTEEVTCQILK